MNIKQIGQRDVDTIELTQTATQAAERMHQRTVGALVAVDAQARPVGIVTDRDLTVRVLAKGFDGQTVLVRDVMTSPLQTATETADVETVLAMMEEGTIRRVPLVDETGRLTGIVSLDDILRVLGEDSMTIGRLLEHETPQAAANGCAATATRNEPVAQNGGCENTNTHRWSEAYRSHLARRWLALLK